MTQPKATLTWLDDTQHQYGGDLHIAYSGRPVTPPHTSSYFSIEYDSGVRHMRPDTDPEWILSYMLVDNGDFAATVALGRHPSENKAKAAAERYEATGEGPEPDAPYTSKQLDLAVKAIRDVPAPIVSPEVAAQAVLTVLAAHGHIRR